MATLGIIRFSDRFVSGSVHPDRTWVDGWNLNPAQHNIRVVGDLNGDNRTDGIITSDWGMGILQHDGSSFRCPFGVPRDTMIGDWRYDATDRPGRDRIMAIENFTGSETQELLVWSNNGMAVFAQSSNSLALSRHYPNGTRFGSWVFSTLDNTYCGSGRFGSDPRKSIVLRSSQGIGIISLESGTFLAMISAGTIVRNFWLTHTYKVLLIADLDGDGQDELLVGNHIGSIAVLKMIGERLEPIVSYSPGVNLGGLSVNGGNIYAISGNFRGGAADEILVSNNDGLHVIGLVGGSLARRAFVGNGVRVDGWIVDTRSNNTILATGDMTSDGVADFLIRSPWGIGLMSVGADNQFRCRTSHPYGELLGEWPLDSSDVIAGVGTFSGSGQRELLVLKPWAGSVREPVFTNSTFVNWHRNIQQTVSTVRPNNLSELVSAVQLIQSRGQVAGIAGSGWSFTNCVVGRRTQALIDTSALNATIGNLLPDIIDSRIGSAGNRLVHVEAGIKLHDLNCRLDALGLALPTMGGSRGQSLAGVLSTGVHGSDVSLPPVADAVRAIHLVGAGGQQWWIEPSFGSGTTTRTVLDRAKARGVLDPSIKYVYNTDWFNAVLVSMGCAGVIYSVVIECRPAFRLRSTTTARSWIQAQEHIRGLAGAGSPRYLEINVNPSDLSCRVTIRNETSEPESIPAGSGGPSMCEILAGVGLIGPGALGLFFGAIGDYIARTTLEITGLGLIPGAGPFLQAKKTAEALKPVEDAHRLLFDLGLAAIHPNDARRVAEVLPTALNLIWAIGAFVVPGRTLVDQIQSAITTQTRPEETRVGASFQIMTGQPSCSIDGSQSHAETDRLVESFEYAVPASRAIEFVDRLISVIGEQRRGSDAIVVNLNLRFTARTGATLGMQQFDRTCHVEVYTFRGLRGNDAFKARLRDIVQQFNAIPHWGQFHSPNESRIYREMGGLGSWQTVMRALSGGSEMFWSDFARERGLLP